MPSFDIVSKINLQEIDNAVNSVLRELSNRYDFKGAKFSLIIDQKENLITAQAEDSYKLNAMSESLRAFGVKRGIDPKAFDFQPEIAASGGTLRQIIKLKNGIEQEIAKKIVKQIKDLKLKVQASIRGDEVRVEGKNRDDLQTVIVQLRRIDYDVPLQFINLRD